jgi:predicted nicotinamide N-methyase
MKLLWNCKGENRGANRITAQAAGRSWRLERPADLETLWQNIASAESVPENQDERLPYWVELWPASIALADWLFLNRERIAGKKCLDLGCGLGLTALVAASLQAEVVAVDYEEEALRYARRNARLNARRSGEREPLWAVMDWRAPAVRSGSLDFIWGGDIMYERRFIAPVLAFLEHALAAGGLVWIAEPDRNVYAHFRDALFKRGWKSVKAHSARVERAQGQEAPVEVSLWELS